MTIRVQFVNNRVLIMNINVTSRLKSPPKQGDLEGLLSSL